MSVLQSTLVKLTLIDSHNELIIWNLNLLVAISTRVSNSIPAILYNKQWVFDYKLYFLINNDFLKHKQANINVKSQRFGIIMTPFSRQNE